VELARQVGVCFGTERYFEFKIEEFCLEKMEEILAFCELSASPAVLEHFRQTFESSRQGRRMREVDPQELRIMMRWIEPTLQWLGYDAASA